MAGAAARRRPTERDGGKEPPEGRTAPKRRAAARGNARRATGKARRESREGERGGEGIPDRQG